MAVQRGVTHVTGPVTPVAGRLPGWARLVRAPNPGPMTLDGTNTWVLRAPGETAAVVVDPGPDDPDHLAAVAALGPVAAVLVTHGHPDHIAGLSPFLTRTAADLHRAPGGRVAGLSITTLPTPGHTADSVSFLVTAGRERAILTGDTILGRGTTVVAWPDGDLGDYLDSLARLTAYQGVPVLPGHGPALADCGAAATFYLAHRRARLAQVRVAVAGGASTPGAVVAEVYRDLDPSLRPAAEWSVRAQLAYLGADRPGGESGPGSPPLDEP